MPELYQGWEAASIQCMKSFKQGNTGGEAEWQIQLSSY